MNKMQKKNEPEPQEIKIATQPEITKGVYSNVALIRHTQHEFVIDFLLQFNGAVQMVSRVILSPNHMRAFSNAVEENLKKYEVSYGKNGSAMKPDIH
jgi:hypothetical protein